MPQRESKKIEVETCLTSKEKQLHYMTLFEIIYFFIFEVALIFWLLKKTGLRCLVSICYVSI